MPEQIAKRLGSNEEELLSALIASMADAVYAVDDAGVVLFANAAALSILGYGSESELIGRPSFVVSERLQGIVLTPSAHHQRHDLRVKRRTALRDPAHRIGE